MSATVKRKAGVCGKPGYRVLALLFSLFVWILCVVCVQAAENGQVMSYGRTDSSLAGDFWFLCSDGVYRFIRQGSMRWKLPLLGRFMATDRFVHRIESEVEKNGSGDNYSMIFVRVGE